VTLEFCRFAEEDQAAVIALDEWTLEHTETNPQDIPGRDDIHDITESYLETGGEFLVGVSETIPDVVEDTQYETPDISTTDGQVIAMGGFLPNEDGHADERTVEGAVELHRMRVAPSVQGQGYGKALLDELERRAMTTGYETLLATTATRQQRAATFYPSAGYTHVDSSTFGDYELLHFEKTLDS